MLQKIGKVWKRGAQLHERFPDDKTNAASRNSRIHFQRVARKAEKDVVRRHAVCKFGAHDGYIKRRQNGGHLQDLIWQESEVDGE